MNNTRNATHAEEIIRWFSALVITGPIHMGEQMLFGLDTLNELKGVMAAYYSQFSNADVATVMLVISTVTIVQSLILAALAGGRWRLFVAGMFGIAGMGEAHHLIQTAWYGAYFPGTVTALAYVWVGAMLLRAVWRQWRHAAAGTGTRLAVA